MAEVFILLGGNLGDREQIFKNAIDCIVNRIGSIVKTSSLFETEPWGFEHELSFLNQVVVIETSLTALEILVRTQEIEKTLGRVRKKNQYSERTIDVDILFYDDQVISMEELEVPHPRIQERLFTLIPLEEIAADFIHPVLRKSISQLRRDCKDSLEVKKYGE